MLTWDFIQILSSVSLLSSADLFHMLLVWFLLSSTDCSIWVLFHNGKSALPYTITYIKITKILACSAKTEGQREQLSSHLHFAKSCLLSVLYVPLTPITHKAPGSTLLGEHQTLGLVLWNITVQFMCCFIGKVPSAVSPGMEVRTVLCLWLPGC